MAQWVWTLQVTDSPVLSLSYEICKICKMELVDCTSICTQVAPDKISAELMQLSLE